MFNYKICRGKWIMKNHLWPTKIVTRSCYIYDILKSLTMSYNWNSGTLSMLWMICQLQVTSRLSPRCILWLKSWDNYWQSPFIFTNSIRPTRLPQTIPTINLQWMRKIKINLKEKTPSGRGHRCSWGRKWAWA